MMLHQVKKDMILCCQRMYNRGYVAANDGNLSLKLGNDRVLCTPTGKSKGFLTEDQLIVVDMDGTMVSGPRGFRPSSEIKMHLMVYREREDISSVVHAHPPISTGFAVAGIPLEKCVLPEVVIVLGAVPIAAYGTPSTEEIPNNIKKLIQDYDAFLLENHGALTLGFDVVNAYEKMETMEHFAQISLTARMLGQENTLSKENVIKLMQVREKLGVKGKNPGCVSCADGSCAVVAPDAVAPSSALQPAAAGSDDLIAQITREVKKQLGM